MKSTLAGGYGKIFKGRRKLYLSRVARAGQKNTAGHLENPKKKKKKNKTRQQNIGAEGDRAVFSHSKKRTIRAELAVCEEDRNWNSPTFLNNRERFWAQEVRKLCPGVEGYGLSFGRNVRRCLIKGVEESGSERHAEKTRCRGLVKWMGYGTFSKSREVETKQN